MSNTERIDLRRARDFGATINVIFEFLRQNWRIIGKSLVFIMGPVLILATIVAGAYMRALMATMSIDAASTPEDLFGAYVDMAPMIGLSTLAFAVSLIFMYGIIAGYVRLYNDRYPEPIEVDDVWREVRHSFLRITGTLIVVAIVTMLPFAVLILPAAATETWWLVVIGFLVAIVPMIYLSVCMLIIVPMRLEEEIGVVAAIRRSMRLMKGRWWFTVWLFIVIQIILTFASVIFQLPVQAIVMMQGIGGVTTPGPLFYIATAFYVIGTYLLYSITVLTSSVQYYNLVEQKDGIGMSDRINEIGAELDEPTATV